MSTQELQEKYLDLTNQVMPQLAREKEWPVRFNHCFQRIILDTLFQDCWYRHLNRTSSAPAYKQLSSHQLQQALVIAQDMIDSPEKVKELNHQSLKYRQKLPKHITHPE